MLDSAVAQALPEYMRPTRWMLLDAMPLSTAGKVNRKALPEPETAAASEEFVSAETETERVIAQVFGDILGIDEVSATASFFDLGGNSLAGTRVVARLADRLDADVSVRDLFDTPTVRGLGASIVSGSRTVARLTPQPRPDRIPLSAAQRRMWFINQFDVESATYNIPLPLRLRGGIDVDSLAAALLDVLARHEVLRTVYPSDDGGPHQQILDIDTVAAQLDWVRATRRSDLADTAARGFDVSTQLPIRGAFYEDGDAVEIVLVAHHIAFDGESMQVLITDLVTAYAARATADVPQFAPLPVQYADYALWQNTALGSMDDPESEIARQHRYWLDTLDGLPDVTDLVMDRPRPAVLDPAAGSLRVDVDPVLAEKIPAFAAEHGATGFMVFHTALAITVARLASTDDVVIGAPIAGRADAALDRAVGMFVNTLVLRTPATPGCTGAELLSAIRTTDLDAFAHADVHFEQLVDALAPQRSTAHAPLFQIALTHTTGALDSGPIDLADLGVSVEPILDLGTAEAKVDLAVSVHESADRTSVEFSYATALFDESTVKRFASVWSRVLEALVTQPSIPIGDIALAEPSVRASIPVSSPASAPRAVSAQGTLVHHLHQRRLDPTHPALICGDETVSYSEFEQRTNIVARELIARGVRPDDVVAVAVERSVQSVTAVWGVIKSGAAYVPIDPGYPAERIEYMIADSAVRLGITVGAIRDQLGQSECTWLDLVDLEATDRDSAEIDPAERNGSITLDNLAYLIYTSGSTGRPKAVAVSNRGITDLMAAHAQVSGTREDGPDTRILHLASPSFDASFFEMIWAIGAGHTLVVAPANDYAGDALQRVLTTGRVTDMVITPSVLASLDPSVVKSVRNLATAGEACPPELVERWAAHGRRVFNFYGPSETTVWATRSRMLLNSPVTIGRAIGGFETYVLDARLHEVPQGVVGELYLAADGLARGYLHRAGLTATTFVANPFSANGSRLYATGDMVRYNASGDLEFAGRADHQVKINGQRVELGEIESVLADQAGVEQAVVLGVSDGDRTRLVGYLVGAHVDVAEVTAGARQRLAGHMVPAQFVVIDELPLTPAGKLDRAALPTADAPAQVDVVSAATAAEHQLERIVATLLGRDEVSVTESFFTLGGDSIMSIQLASAAKAAGITLTPRQIFEHRTVREMAQAAAVGENRTLVPEPVDGPRGDIAVSPIAAWMIEHSTAPTDYADFSQSMVFAAPEALTLSVLRDIIGAVVAVHPMLTASLEIEDGAPRMRAGNEFAPRQSVTAVMSGALIGEDEFADDLRDAHASALARMNPAAGQLVAAVLVADADGAKRVVLAVHHLGVDIVSWPILIEDIATAWTQSSAGDPIELRPEATSARAWLSAVDAQVDARADEVSYWLARLPERPTPLSALPIEDAGSAADRLGETEVRVFRMDAAVTEDVLTELPEAFGGSADDVLLAALTRAIRSWQRDNEIDDEADIYIQVESHGRDERIIAGDDDLAADLSRTVGWFTTISPMVIDTSGSRIATVKAAKEERLGRPSAGAGFGILRYLANDPALRERRLPSIGFNFFGARAASVGDDVEGLRDQALLPALDAPSLPPTVSGAMLVPNTLSINVTTDVAAGQRFLSAEFTYVSRVVTADSVDDLAVRWERELAALAAEIADGAAVGLSPTDVPGTGITQPDLDQLAVAAPGALVLPLSPLQRGLYFQAEMVPAGQAGTASSDSVDVYVTQAVVDLAGDIDPKRMADAADALLARHQALRSGFVRTDSGAVVAIVPPALTTPMVVDDMRGVEPHEVSARVEEIADQQRVLPFDMSAPPLLRLVLVRHDDGAHLVVTNHHILFDGWSGPLVLADLLALYATGEAYTATQHRGSTDFGDHVLRLARADRGAGLRAWREIVAPLEGPTLVSNGLEATAQSLPRDHTVFLDAETTAAIEQVARTHGVTLSNVLQFAWAVVLSRLTGNRVVTFGEAVSGRPADLDGAGSIVGLFINTLPVVVDVDPAATIAEVLAKLQSDKVSVLDHQHVGLSEIMVDAGVPALFDTLFVHESYPVDTDSLTGAAASGPGEMTVRGVDSRDATHFPLYLSTAPAGDRLAITLKYLPAAFADEQAATFVHAVGAILDTVVGQPQSLTADISLLVPADRALVDGWSRGPVVEVAPQTVDELLAGQTLRDGEAIALVYGEREVTYREFSARVWTLARTLIDYGVGPEVPVALCIPRSVEMVVAIHAVVAAGGQYVPVHTDSPDDRAAYMLEISGAAMLLVSDRDEVAQVIRVAGERDLPVLDIDCSVDVDLDTPQVTDADRLAPLRLDNPMYTLFTSGSTGRPKGVTTPHRGILNRLWWGIGAMPIDATDRVVLKSPYTFDVSLAELFAPIMVGGRIVILKAGGHLDPLYLADEIARTGGTTAHFVPSMMSVFLDVLGQERVSALTSMRIISTTGEALPPAMATTVRQWLPQVQLENLYGPTEASVEISGYDAESVTPDDHTVPIGTVVSNGEVAVLDSRLRPVPAGFPGELYIGGVQVGRGYAGRPDLSADRYVADPYGDAGARMYRTGDLVRWNTKGELEYLGRTDFQVKLRGQRVELGEIESVIASVPGVVHVATTVVKSPTGDSLVAWIAPAASIDMDEVNATLAAALPEYMRPSAWVVMDAMPLNNSGKVSRQELPAPVFTESEFVEPVGHVEEVIAAIVADVLGVERVSVIESFFDIGGNSLSATRVAARVSDVLNTELSVRDLFAKPSVRALAASVDIGVQGLPPVTAVIPRPAVVPLSFSQQRMWFINQFDTSLPTYNIPAGLRLTGLLDVDALRMAVDDVVARHETLRTTFPMVDGAPAQLVHEVGSVGAQSDWAEVVSDDDLASAATTGFDVATETGFRVRLRRVSDDEHLLLVVLHHIAGDGESMTPLVADMVTAYTARSAGHAPEYPPLEIQFADYALWQQAELGSPDDPSSVVGRQMDYWTTALASLPDVLELPADRPRPPVASYQGARVGFEIPAQVATATAELARRHGVTSFMVLHGALAVLLARLSATDDIAIATPIAGRGQQALDPLIGMFVNTLVLRAEIDPAMSFAAVLEQVRVTDLDAFANADLPFESLVEQLNPVRSQSFSPLAQVMLNLAQPAAHEPVPIGGDLSVAPMEPLLDPAQVDLTFTIATAADGQVWTGSLVYATDLFDEDSAQQIVTRLVRLLGALTASPDAPVADAPMIDEAERHEVLEWSVGTSEPKFGGLLREPLSSESAEGPGSGTTVSDSRGE
uniref:non-ribosomal peptide synthetase n=1 Tax=Gordonia effusa TaxID=263908 RepID=UPI001B8B2A83|nr:non-ribosomal peptide synthetase [Gordonia effusa]